MEQGAAHRALGDTFLIDVEAVLQGSDHDGRGGQSGGGRPVLSSRRIASPAHPSFSHTAVWLSGCGKLFLYGGCMPADAPTGRLFDPVAGSWQPCTSAPCLGGSAPSSPSSDEPILFAVRQQLVNLGGGGEDRPLLVGGGGVCFSFGSFFNPILSSCTLLKETQRGVE